MSLSTLHFESSNSAAYHDVVQMADGEADYSHQSASDALGTHLAHG
jgi:hypothetical protein